MTCVPPDACWLSLRADHNIVVVMQNIPVMLAASAYKASDEQRHHVTTVAPSASSPAVLTCALPFAICCYPKFLCALPEASGLHLHLSV